MSVALVNINTANTSLKFSGHDTFECRLFWLKKGYDYISSGKKFTDTDAVIALGVGKNMVSSIRYWLRAFNITGEDDVLTEFAHLLLSDEGWDPYLQDDASLWLLHYHLINNNYASIYQIIFTELRKERFVFDEDVFVNYVINRFDLFSNIDDANEKRRITIINTLKRDFNVFIKMYYNPFENDALIEDSYSSVLSELDILVKQDGRKYLLENIERNTLPAEVFLYTVLNNSTYGNSISLEKLENDLGSPGLTFALNRKGLLDKIDEITNSYSSITFSDQAGIKELQFKKKPDFVRILNKYYGK